MQQQNYIDMCIPQTKPDEALCTGCWKVEKKAERQGWAYFSFKTLTAQEICPACVNKWRDHFTRLQELGL